MKKYLSFLAAALPAILFLFSSCDKDDNTPKTKRELLTQASWKFKSATINGSDASGLIATCEKDNILFFAAAGTGNINEGATKCNATDPDSVPFTWSFSQNETVINLSSAFITGGETNVTLVSLTETELVVSFFYTPPVGPSREMIVTFQH
ncbi:MAG: lipocalin family protein [Bacteroidota bacterium]